MIDYIIVGQGLAGTILHRKLSVMDKKAIVIDNGHKTSSSTVAAGMINPITGRKYVKSWRIEDFFPVAKETYSDLSELINVNIYKDVLIHRALYSIKDENVWHSRLEDPRAEQYIVKDADTSIYEDAINNVISYGSLRGGQVNLKVLISKYQEFLKHKNEILLDEFDYDKLDIQNESVVYGAIKAKAIVFAEGSKGAVSPFWSFLPFEPVKGEVLLVKIEGHPFTDVLRHKMFITPIEDELYWVGSGYQWDYDTVEPTTEGREKIVNQLDSVLNLPYTIERHIAGIRPSVKGRKPLIGVHPTMSNVYIFNGMGTKGTSLAPYWAEQFVSFLEDDEPLDFEVDIKRYL